MTINYYTERPSNAVANTSAKQPNSSAARWNFELQQQKPQKQLLSQYRQSLVDAGNIDQQDRDSRASSFIISGLPTSLSSRNCV